MINSQSFILEHFMWTPQVDQDQARGPSVLKLLKNLVMYTYLLEIFWDKKWPREMKGDKWLKILWRREILYLR